MKLIVALATVAMTSSAALAGPFDQGMVGGQLRSNVRVDNINQRNSATLGYARQKLNVGSVDGGKVFGNVQLNVRAKSINQRNSATLGYSEQEVSIGSIK